MIPLTLKLPPTFKFFSIPTPPLTISDPSSLVVDCVVFLIDTMPPIFTSLPIPAPPLTTNAPFVVVVEAV